MIPYDFHYQWSAGAYFILTSFLSLFLFWVLFNARQKLTFAKGMISSRSLGVYWFKAILYCASLALCAIALMGPVGNGHYPEGALPPNLSTPKGSQPLQLKRKAHSIIILLDVSASMAVTDSSLQKSRLDYAKEIADAIVAGLNGEAIALYTFTSKTLQQSPLTNDYIFIRLTLNETLINEGGIPGTDISDAITQMRVDYFPPMATKAEKSKLKTLILLSDGEDTAIEALPEAQRQPKESAIANLVRGAAENNLRVYTIGMGTAAGGTVPKITSGSKPVHSHLNAKLLQAIAKIGRGNYFEANRYSTPQLAKELLADMAQDPPYYEENYQEILNALLQSLFGEGGLVYDRYVQIFAGLALFCLGAALLLPDLLRNTPLLILLLSCLQASLYGQALTSEEAPEWQPEVQHAKVYVEANMFDEARAIYESLLNIPLSEAQKGVLHYDIGTTYLLQEAWNSAIAQLSIAAATKEAFAFFFRHVHKNLALAYYENALSVQKEDPQEAFKLLQLALKNNELAQNNDELPKAQKSHLEIAIKVQLAQTRLLADQHTFASASPSEDLQRLLDAISDAQEHLQFVEEQPMSKELFADYCAFFAEEQKLWLPLWKEEIEKISSQDQRSQLQDAEKHYLSMIALTKKNDALAAFNEANAAQRSLLELMDQLTEGSALKGKLRQLLNAYERLLKTKKWKKERLRVLQERYAAIVNSPESDDWNLLKEGFDKSQQQLTEAIKASQSGDLPLANLLARDSAQKIRLALVQMPPVSSMSILNALLQQQTYLLDLETKNLKDQEEEHPVLLAVNVLSILREDQASLLSLCELYFKTLYQEQVNLYRHEGRCQSVPWSEALPYFENGKLAAARASDQLQQEQVNLSKVMEQQTQAVTNWQKALAEIKNPSSKKTTCTIGQTSQTSPEAGSAQPDNGLATLLQMEQEDRRPAERTETRILQSNEQRPW